MPVWVPMSCYGVKACRSTRSPSLLRRSVTSCFAAWRRAFRSSSANAGNSWNRTSNVYIVVTGAAGFIGSNLVKALNARGERDIIAVDDLAQTGKFRNLVDCDIADYVDKDEFLVRLGNGDFDDDVAVMFHQGACADTMETDGR